MPPEPITVDDEDYASSEDSDFAPDDAPEQEDAAESSDGEDQDENDAVAARKAAAATAAAPSKKRKQAGGDASTAAEDAGFENSGDEAIIEKGKKRQKRAGRKLEPDDDEGGEGGLIKTRSMRAVEKLERKAQPVAGPVTVDVDALWASMVAAPVVPTPPTAEAPPSGSQQEPGAATTTQQQQNGTAAASKSKSKSKSKTTDTIKIKRTYNFAGKVHTEEKLVPRDSAEARLYLASQNGADATATSNNDGEKDDDNGEEQHQQPDKRMPRKAFRSAYEPTPLAADDSHGQRADLDLGIAVRLQARLEARDAKARKLNTVEKSRMDWAGFVDKEGIKDELVLAGRAKGNFAGQQDFLARTEARREDDARRVRLAGKAS
ncbi:unnamed protein product [Discula destructiva]